jgi:hypothetical protein
VQGRVGNTLELTGIVNDFLHRMKMTQQPGERTEKWDYVELKNYCTTKGMVTRWKRQPTEWEKIFASYTSDKGLMTRIYRDLNKSMIQ